jgi:two-component system phosphate regulon response regulator PhoB
MARFKTVFIGQQYMGLAYEAVLSQIESSVSTYPLEINSVDRVMEDEYDIILLESGGDKSLAFEVASKIRNHPSYLGEPIWFTADGFSDDDKRDASLIGAWGCFPRTINPSEFRRTIQRLMIFHRNHKMKLRKGSLILDAGATRTYINKEEVDLTLSEFRLISLILRNTYEPLSRDEIMREVWRTKIEKGTFSTHIANLNKKLETWEHKIVVTRKDSKVTLTPAMTSDKEFEDTYDLVGT